MPGKRQRSKSLFASNNPTANCKKKNATLDEMNLEIKTKYNQLRSVYERQLREPESQPTPLWIQIFEDFQKKKQTMLQI